MFRFEILYTSSKSKARVGKIHTPHGVIDTPGFVPVATNGSLKGVDNKLLGDSFDGLVFCNTYHLALHPGGDIVEQAGGLHSFIGRDKPIITDSGGFQVFSLAYGSVADELKSRGTKQQHNAVVKISEDGVVFRSYRDGSLVHFSPETSVAIQKQLGADIIIPFDELPPYNIDDKALVTSLARTHRWQKRSWDAHAKNPRNQAMYAVVHGGVNAELRKDSACFLRDIPFDGFAVGGSLGKDVADIDKVLQYSVPFLPDTHPRHLLGIADTKGIDCGVRHGMDTFDSCYPMRSARHGVLFLTGHARLKITAGKFKQDFSAIDASCPCYTCKNFTRAYVHHLFKAHEPTAHTLASVHNVVAMDRIMQNYREDIVNNRI